MIDELPKAYNPLDSEQKIYKLWQESGFFNPDNLPLRQDFDDKLSRTAQGKPYCIVMPPPNVTGVLHVGHALGMTIQDILIRFERMRGRRTLWLPGTDHAAIATQSKVEDILYKKEGLTRHDLGREKFLERVRKFAQESHDAIVMQIRRIGASCDWSREAYTLDDRRSLAVKMAFKNMYEDGLIYRGARIVNWDPKLQTVVSDDEVEWKQETAPLYYLKYGPFTISTARPETKFGDKYVVMHPDDQRYSQYHNGQKIDLEWINGPVTTTVIKDTAVDPAFGTGVMTITPWHDNADFEIAQRHNLDKEQIIDFAGKLLPIAGPFAGQHIKKARPLIVEKLKEKGLLVKTDPDYIHSVAVNSRGGGLIEPQIKEQWFVDVNKKFKIRHSKLNNIHSGQAVTLKELMRETVQSGQIKIIPEHFTKIYYHWIDNLRDWNISRQIWYGHRIPVWYHEPKCVPKQGHEVDAVKCRNIIVSDTQPVCEFCDAEYEQDPDTLDTWFSSGLWTFSTLGWPGETKDLELYHPTDVLETGYDILFFWVARMILMTTYNLGDIPFRTVYLHGLVRDKDRQKMSKSKGNIIDPLGVIDTYGADALRMALIFSTAAGNDIPLAEEKIKGMKYFANKLWNIARFILANTDDASWQSAEQLPRTLTEADKNIMKELNETISAATSNIDKFVMHQAAQEIYQFAWHNFADKYIEASKPQLKNTEQAPNTKLILAHCLLNILRLLHPFMPFLTEEIYQKLPLKQRGLLMVQKWPSSIHSD